MTRSTQCRRSDRAVMIVRGLSRGVHAVLAAILCITMVLSCIGAATAQPAVNAFILRNREYGTPRDSVRYDESLRGRYTWDIGMEGETATPAAIEVLTKQTFEKLDPEPNSTTREDSNFRYRWEVPDVSGAFLDSDLEVTFQPGFDSQRTLSPAVLEDQVTIQTLQVKVTPREGGFLGMHVTVFWDETQEARAVLVPDSDRPRLDWQGVEDYKGGPRYKVDWAVKSPVNEKEYEFNVQLRIENKLYPNKVVYKPNVHIHIQDSTSSSRLTGSTVTIEDDILGKIGFSTPSTSRWQIDQSQQRRVLHEGESAVWGGVGDYTTCKSIDQDDNPVERSSDFLTIDDRVTVWVNLHDLRVSVNVKFKWYAPALEWYAPDGSLYREQSVTTSSPPEGEVAWNYPVHDSIEVKGKPPSRMLGDWEIKISVDGAEPIVAGFRIRRAPSSISVSFSTQTVSQGENLLVTGGLLEAHEGVEIVLDYVRPDGSIVKRAVATEPGGSFSDRYLPDALGAWAVAVSWEGNEDYEGVSMTRGFTVTTTTRPAEEALAAGPPIDLLLVAGIIVVIAAVGAVALLYRKKRSSLPPR